MCLALAVVAYLSVLTAPASAELDWTATTGPCGGGLTSPPVGDPLTDAAASQWYACWTARESNSAIEDLLEGFSYREENSWDEEGEPNGWDRYPPGEMAWRQLGVMRSVDDRLSLLQESGDMAVDRLNGLIDAIAGVESSLGAERPCADVPDHLLDGSPCEGSDDRRRVPSGQTLEEIRELLVEIRDQAAEPPPAATVEIDPEDLAPIVAASEDARDGFIETVWGSNGMWIGLAFLAVFWRVIRPGRT